MLGSVIADNVAPIGLEPNFAGGGCYRSAVDLRQQLVDVFSDHVNDAFLKGLGRGECGGFPHCLLPPICVPASQLCERSNVGHGVIDAFANRGCGRVRIGFLVSIRGGL